MTSLVDRFIHKYGRLPTEFDPDYLEMLQMSKYRILAVPDFKPGKCANCGSSKDDGRNYIDFGKEVDWYGIIYLCGLCLKDIASAMGLFKQYEEDIKLAKDALVRNSELKAAGVELKETVLHTFEEVKSYFANLQSIGSDSASDSSPGMGTDETATRSESTFTNESGSTPTKQRATKSTTSSGPKDLPSLAELLNSKP